MGFSNILALCGGLGLFLFGMKYMGAGLELAAGPKLNNLLEKLTRNPVMGFLLGVFVTACVQSSSATTIMCMGFLNAGIMDLLQAAGVILGANVGTTMTSILIALDISWLELKDWGTQIMVTAIVLAAGVGSRMKSEKAKQFLEVAGHEVLYYSLRAFDEHPEVDSIVLVTKEEFVEHCQKELAERYQFAKVRDICIGGKERYDSVYQGLSAIGAEGENGIVLIHDGARPFVTAEMISASIACARECGACTVGVPAKDTIKIVDTDHYGVETPERKFVYQIQTPQTFQVPLLHRAYETMYKAKRNGDTHNITDDTMLVEQYAGVRCKVVEGAYENIKITTPEDLAIAEIFVEKTLKKI